MVTTIWQVVFVHFFLFQIHSGVSSISRWVRRMCFKFFCSKKLFGNVSTGLMLFLLWLSNGRYLNTTVYLTNYSFLFVRYIDIWFACMPLWYFFVARKDLSATTEWMYGFQVKLIYSTNTYTLHKTKFCKTNKKCRIFTCWQNGRISVAVLVDSSNILDGFISIVSLYDPLLLRESTF